MSLVQINRNPPKRQLRQFGLIAAVAIPAIGWFWSASQPVMISCALAGGGFAAVGTVRPRLLKPVFLALSFLTLPLGLVISEFVIALMYFGLFVPMGLLFRLAGRDALRLKPQPVQTWWQPKPQPNGTADYFLQWSRNQR
jgi:Saxitoxin biosynthesis operon protein SxtJ